jgi:COX assembly protein 1
VLLATAASFVEKWLAMTDRVIVGSNKLPSNPTPLSAPQEQQVRDLYYKNVRAKCAEEIEST